MDSINSHVLVVDGHRTNRLQICVAAQTLGHTFALAEDGRQAPDMLRAEASGPVLLDFVVPLMNGYQAPAEMKAGPNLRDIPVIVISAGQEMASVVKGIELGAEDLAPLTFDPILPKTRVDSYLDRKRLRDQRLEYMRQVEHLTELRDVYPLKADRPRLAEPLYKLEQGSKPCNRATIKKRSASSRRAWLWGPRPRFSAMGD